MKGRAGSVGARPWELSLLEGVLSGLDTNDFSPSLENEPGRCCVVLRPRAPKQPLP